MYSIEIWFENRFPTPYAGVTNGNSIKYCRKTANINVKKLPFFYRSVYYIHGPELRKLIFVVLYVS